MQYTIRPTYYKVYGEYALTHAVSPYGGGVEDMSGHDFIDQYKSSGEEQKGVYLP